jgi:hypothetical protein
MEMDGKRRTKKNKIIPEDLRRGGVRSREVLCEYK